MQLRRSSNVLTVRCSCVLVLFWMIIRLVTGSLTQEQMNLISSRRYNSWYFCKPDDVECIHLNFVSDNNGYISEADFQDHPAEFRKIMEGVSEGLTLATEECKNQFQPELWNCPVTDIVEDAVTGGGSREVSFVQAISAAGVMHSVARTCNREENNLCTCGSVDRKDKLKESDQFKWGGCSDNIKFGEKVSEQFYNVKYPATAQVGEYSRRHNERVGIMAVKRTYKNVCRCIGLCGNCTIKLCWKKTADFRVTGSFLKKKYRRSKYVKDKQEFLNRFRNGSESEDQRISKTDLVHYEPSPDYCRTVSVQGRECAEKEERLNGTLVKSSCQTLCCGRGFEERVLKETYKCYCQWRGNLECGVCEKEVRRFYCN